MTSDSQPEKAAQSGNLPALKGDGSAHPQITSEELFAGRQEIEIRHAGENYRLRITKNGKLILHK